VSAVVKDTRLLLPVTAVALVALAVWYGNARLAADVERLELDKRTMLAEIVRLEARAEALDDDLRTIREREADAAALRAARFAAPQDRLAVSEALDALGIEHRINRLRVSFAPEEVIVDRPYTGGVVELVSTPVSITLDAASEGDVLGFLDALPALFSGVATAESLRLRRVGDGEAQAPEPASGHRPSVMSAQIALRWETVRASEAP
jgi:hypothetical protein